MKAREPRRKVMINARVRVGSSWRDACILDLSSRGLMIQSAEPIPERTYLELRRGRHVIVARVIWSRDRRYGLRSQDVLPTDAIVAELEAAASVGNGPMPERRADFRRNRPAATLEASRWRGRSIEFAALAIIGATCAAMGMQTIKQALMRPLVSVEQALDRG